MDTHQNAFVSYVLANLYKHQKEDTKSELKYRRAIQINPKYSLPYIEWGNLLRKQGKFEKAEDKYKKAAKIHPKPLQIYFILAELYKEQKRYTEAISVYRLCLIIEPENSTSFFHLGEICYHQGKYTEAIENFSKAVDLQPTAEAYRNLGWILYNSQMYEEAILAYKTAIKMMPYKCMSHISCSLILLHCKKEAEAMQAYSKAAHRLIERLNEKRLIIEALRSEIELTRGQIESSMNSNEKLHFETKLNGIERMLGLLSCESVQQC